MIEIVYKEEKQEAKNGENLFNLPRNIRQIGLTAGNIRIYIAGIVNIAGILEYLTLQTTRLSTVITLADTITQGILGSFSA